MANQIDLKGRMAVVTGGAQGFGRAVTERFVASGATVAIWDRDTALAEKTAAAIGKGVTVYACDVGDPASVKAATDATLKAMGRIDILINNAGIAGANAKVWETDVDEWRKVMRINLDGPFICSRAVVPAMIAQNYGRIVNIASIAGKEGKHNPVAYVAAKAGVIGLTKAVAFEAAPHGVLCNVITPGSIWTENWARMKPEDRVEYEKRHPVGRFGRADEVAALVSWLSSDECSFSTGAVFDISGGRAGY